jgi:hypothetical protein
MTVPIPNRGSLAPGNETSRNPELGAAHPALPAVVLLVFFAVFMAAIAPLDFTSILRKIFPIPSQTVPHQDSAVWVDANAGVYYCEGSIMFGKSRGRYMRQVDALQQGYQPALGTYCSGPAWNGSDVRPAKPAQPAPNAKLFENPQSRFENAGTAP